MSALSAMNNALWASLSGGEYASFKDASWEEILAAPDPAKVIFYILFPRPQPPDGAADAVNDFVRAQMREEGFARRIMPPMALSNEVLAHPVAFWQGLGVPAEELSGVNDSAGTYIEYVWRHDYGRSLVEWERLRSVNVMLEAQYQERLAARIVTAEEYRRHAIAETSRLRYAALDNEHCEKFRTVLSGVVSDILNYAGSGETQ